MWNPPGVESNRPLRSLVFGVVSIALILETGLWLASFARPDIVIDLGPSTGSYGTGFTTSWEYNPVSARFVGRYSSLELPLDVSGSDGDEIELTLRSARLWRSSIRTGVFVNQERAISFRPTPSAIDLNAWAENGRTTSPFESFESTSGSAAIQEGPLHIEIATRDGPIHEYALAVDWLRLAGARVHIPLRAFSPRLLVLSLLPLLLWSGQSNKVALGITAGAAVVVMLAAAVDPFWVVHASSRLWIGSIGMSAILLLLFRRWSPKRWLLLLFVAGCLIKGGGLFSPSYFYGDVRSHRRFVLAYADHPGNFWERGVGAQKRAGVGYPSHVAGRDYAFPYSPLFYLPFLPLVPDQERIDEAMKLAALVAAALEPLLVFALTRAAFGHQAALFAGGLSVFLPPLYSRLLLAMWPAIVGHWMSCLAMAAAAISVLRPEDRRAWFAYWVLLFASLALYVTNPIIVSAFVLCLALVERRYWLRLLAPLAGAGVLTTGLLYWPFLITLFQEIIPRIAATDGPATLNEQSALLALSRIPTFFGWLYPVLTVAGIEIARRGRSSLAYRALIAYAAAFALLVGFRVLGLGLFKAMKEILFVGPLITIGTGVALASLSERGPKFRIAAALVAAGLAAWGIAQYVRYLAPVTFLEGMP